MIYFEDAIEAGNYSAYMQKRMNAKGLHGEPTDIVTPILNHGRWIIRCPGGCGDDVFASKSGGVFSCSLMPCPARDIYQVVFPSFKDELEKLLEKRPVHPSGMKIHANWAVGETIEDIKAENLVHEVS